MPFRSIAVAIPPVIVFVVALWIYCRRSWGRRFRLFKASTIESEFTIDFSVDAIGKTVVRWTFAEIPRRSQGHIEKSLSLM